MTVGGCERIGFLKSLVLTVAKKKKKKLKCNLKKKKKKLGKINALGPGNPNSWNQWVNVEATDKSQLLQPFQLEAVELGLERAKGLSLLLF